jgi:hypothetical protein
MDVVPPGTSQSPTPLQLHISTSHPLAQAQQLKQRPRGKKINTLKFRAITIFFRLLLRLLVPSIKSVLISCLRWAIDFLSYLMTRVNLPFSFNVFLLPFSASILFVSATHLETCQHNFLTNRDAHRELDSLFQ